MTNKTRKLIRDSTLQFLQRTPIDHTSVIAHWLELPLPKQHQLITVKGFGEVTTGVYTIIRMGHLRSAAPTLFLPCSDPYTEYCDDECVSLPTCKTVEGTIYRIPFELLPVVLDIMTGYFANHRDVRLQEVITKFIRHHGGPNCDKFFPISCYLFDSVRASNVHDSLLFKFLIHIGRHVAPCDKNVESTKSVPLRNCYTCSRLSGVLWSCRQCRLAYYCDAECQKIDWPRHKLKCPPELIL